MELDELDLHRLPPPDREGLDREVSDPVQHALRALIEHARNRHKKVHGSAVVELENYARHVGVTERPSVSITAVISGVGMKAIELAEGESVTAGDVRKALRDQCNDPFSSCSRAARRILGEE